MSTGSGKSAIYQIAGLLTPGATLVVSPLIALQRDQVDSLADAAAGEAAHVNSAMGERAREEAFELMLRHASELGANAIIGMRYDANEVAQGVTEVLAYGTAVVVEARPRSTAS
jgi:uncharacterized protein YbjQ (UPF0145 family)